MAVGGLSVGLASGIDIDGMIEKMMAIEKRPIYALQAEIQEIESYQKVYGSLAPLITDLESAAGELSEENLNKVLVDNDNIKEITVTAESDALVGVHDMVIHQLASSHRLASQGWQDADSTPISSAPGTFTVQIGADGEQISVEITTETSLNDLAKAINAEEGDVTASVVSDGTVGNAYRLVLTSVDTGVDNTVIVSSNPTDLDFDNNTIEDAVSHDNNSMAYTGTVTTSGAYTGSTSKTYQLEIISSGAADVATYKVSTDGGMTWDDNGGSGYVASTAAVAIGGNTDGVDIAFSDSGTLTAGDRFFVDATVPTLQEAKNAVFELDGILQTRASNEIEDALEGITLTLNIADEEEDLHFEIKREAQPVIDKLNNFIEAYNELVDMIREQQKYDPESDEEAGILLGDGTANLILSQLRSEIFSPAEGVEDDNYRTLFDIGVSMNENGGLTLDSSELEEMLEEHRSDVIRVLASSTYSANSQISVTNRPDEIEAGSYAVNITQPPTKGDATALAAQSDTLAADENIFFTYSTGANDDDPTYVNFSVELISGSDLRDVINRLNSAFKTEEVRLQAYNDSGTLTIEATEYGSDLAFSFQSNVASGANTSRIGTGVIEGQGQDVEGTIGGKICTGVGATLIVDEETGDDLADMKIEYTGSATGSVGSVNVTEGADTRFKNLVAFINDGDESVLGARNSSLADQIEAIQDSIQRKEARLEKVEERYREQFAAMEEALSVINQQGDFLIQQLALL